jgi:hypothetical protein
MSKASTIISELLQGKEPKELIENHVASTKTIYKWRKIAELMQKKSEIEQELYCRILDIVLAKK